MVVKKRIFFFKTIRYIFEPLPEVASLEKEYDMINIMSYQDLRLPGFKVRKKKTPVINLNQDLDDVFSNFNDTTRNEVRRSEKIEGLEIKISDDNFSEAYSVYSGHEFSQGRVPERRSEFQNCKIFSGYYNGEMLSTIICFDSEKYLRAKAISSKRMEKPDKEILKIISYITRRLVWEICKYGKENHYIGFDLGSINLTDPAKESIARFKKSFGGDIVDEYLFTYKSKRYLFFESLVKIRLLFLKFTNKLGF